MADAGRTPTPENITMFEAFEWYVPADHKHWQRLKRILPDLQATGIDNIWIPPACKASCMDGNGYDIYDLYDLGEFDQQGCIATKWGLKRELVDFIDTANSRKMNVYYDAVLNHRANADGKERCMAQEVDPWNRYRAVSPEYEIDAWLNFNFPGRKGKYSTQEYHWYHFSGVDYNAITKKTAIYRILGDHNKSWARWGDVDHEKGNYDYLMHADLDYSHPEVAQDVINWGKWIPTQLNIKGIRFDAVKHYSVEFLRRFLHHLEETHDCEDWFFVGEYWKDSLVDMRKYLEGIGHKFSLFDAPLVFKFCDLGRRHHPDLRGIFDGTLVKHEPINSVTLVMNHDTQPGQLLEAPISPFFKPLAYALILLRKDGYPCVFYGDVYGIRGYKPFAPACGGAIPDMVLARKLYAYGRQVEYFDFPTCIGWVRMGTWDRPFGCAVVMSYAGLGIKRMFVGEDHIGETWTDVLCWQKSRVVIDPLGYGNFLCSTMSVSIWVNEDAEGRERFGKFDNDIYGLASETETLDQAFERLKVEGAEREAFVTNPWNADALWYENENKFRAAQKILAEERAREKELERVQQESEGGSTSEEASGEVHDMATEPVRYKDDPSEVSPEAAKKVDESMAAASGAKGTNAEGAQS